MVLDAHGDQIFLKVPIKRTKQQNGSREDLKSELEQVFALIVGEQVPRISGVGTVQLHFKLEVVEAAVKQRHRGQSLKERHAVDHERNSKC